MTSRATLTRARRSSHSRSASRGKGSRGSATRTPRCARGLLDLVEMLYRSPTKRAARPARSADRTGKRGIPAYGCGRAGKKRMTMRAEGWTR